MDLSFYVLELKIRARRSKMGDQFQSSVKGLSFKGLGVVEHPNGQIFFVANAWPGDEAIFEIESVDKSFGFAKLVELLKPSPDRRTPPCPYQGFELGQCGGCPWMIATYESQLKQKDKTLNYLLERASVLTDRSQVKPIIGSPSKFAYRNRAQLKTNGECVGYVTAKTNEIAPIGNCMILTEKNQQTLQDIVSKLPNPDWQPQGKFRWNFIEIDDQNPTYELNKKQNFRQANDAQNFVMKNWLQETLSKITTKTSAIELFAGSGNFTEILAQSEFEKIYAYEGSSDAIRALNDRNLNGVKGFVSNLYSAQSWSKVQTHVKDPKVLVLDPPREGFEGISSFVKLFPSLEHIIYISCDPSTFSRDIKKLRGQKFELVELQPIDQFPQTPHIEVLSYLTVLKN